ncbi:putative pectinesterase/pectinesterase inhibitor 28 [Nymphaea thermarum]|nr:putative pectinesterase/pectinesterase inhibitor 28 [Nymphaea thermarum]
MGAKTILVSTLFGVAVVAVVIAVAVTETKKKGQGSGGDGAELSTRSEMINTICSPTDYKETCTTFLSGAVNSTAKPKEVIQAAVNVTIEEVTKAFNLTHDLAASGNGTHDDMTQQALENCKELLQYARDELHDTFADVSANDMKDLPSRADDLRNWLSAVISYQVTCLDGFNNSNAKETMEKGLKVSSELSSNALAIVTELSNIFASFSISFKTGRRLFSEEESVDKLQKDEYPEWMSAEDRRMLASLHPARRPTPNVVVAKDGTGQFKTINDALNAMPKTYVGRYVIYVKAGIYNEQVLMDKSKVNVLMYGDGPRRTIVSGSKNFVDGVQTFKTATFAVIGDGFMAHSMGFRNTAGAAKHQAVALRVQSDQAVFYNCRMDGYQDTLYAQTHRQFYRNCVISGTIDFIFGDSSAIFQNCLIIVRRPLDNQQNTVTAHGRTDRREPTGLVIQNCRIVPDGQLFPDRLKIPSYLGRPWKEYSRTVVMESTIGDVIQPAGWMPWDGDFALKTLFYAEYNNKGPGAITTGRVKWPGFKVITDKREALQYTVGPFLDGTSWLPASGTPFVQGLVH